MISTSKAIVLKTIKYGDTSLIIHVFTKEHGKIAFIVKGARKVKTKIKANIIQPLSILEIQYRLNSKKEIQLLTEARLLYIYKSIPVDMVKTAMALYLLELINRSIRSKEENTGLFTFLYQFLLALDDVSNYSNWHFIFMLECTKYLGFYPQNNYSEDKCHFDPELGIFEELKVVSFQFDKSVSLALSQLLFSDLWQAHLLQIPKPTAKKLLSELERFFGLHVPNFSEIRSLEVYRQVFS